MVDRTKQGVNMKKFEHGDKLLAESENYYIIGSYEEVQLYRKSDDKYLASVGHFYGDAEAVIIDKNEKYCVSVGCGVIVYRLKEPFKGYMYDRKTDQWYEFGRGPENIDWIKDVNQISDDEVELTDWDDNKKVLKIQLL